MVEIGLKGTHEVRETMGTTCHWLIQLLWAMSTQVDQRQKKKKKKKKKIPVH